MVADQIVIADPKTIKSDLEYMVSRWDELPMPARFELRALKQESRAQTATFAPDWIDEGVDWAERMNGLGFNLYAVRNPIRGDIVGPATDADIIGSCFLWADCDDPASAGNILRFDGPKWSASVITGRVPSTRVHIYWQLQDFCLDMSAWRSMQESIATHFGSDKSVVNPSRVMRLGGTVTYPALHKLERGYIKELTEIRTEYPDQRPRVTLDQMRRVFGVPAQAPAITIDTGPAPLDRERARIKALSGQDWHHEVVRLVASYVAKGLSDAEIHGLTDTLTLAGYTVEQTRREVQTAIDGARRKGWTPDAPAPNFDYAPASAPAQAAQDAPAKAAWAIQTAARFTADFVAPEYLIEGVIQRGRLYTLTAPTGSGKTAVMLYISTAMSRGDTVCELETEQGDVIYMAGENPDDVRARTIATMESQGIDPASCRLHFIPGTFSIRQDMQAIKAAMDALPNVVLVVVDTLAAYFDGDDSNSNAQMLDFARILRALTTARTKPAVIVPAHPVKNAAKNNLTPMGGSALLNEVDGNLCLWKREAAVEMHWQGKHRGAEFAPLMFELKGVESAKIKDSRGRVMPTVMAIPLLETRAMEIATLAVSMEDRLLLNIERYDAQSIRQRCVEIGMVSSAGKANSTGLSRMLEKLRGEKLITRLRSNWLLTPKGEEAVEIIKNGGSIVDPDL